MHRKSYQALLEWKSSADRKPLILRGARQVGKTYLLKSFGEKEYANLAYFNFEKEPKLDELFSEKLEPRALLEKLSLYAQKTITPETLIVFDEIQASENALSSLKYFQEEAPEYHIAAAGSLLGVKLSKARSFPVGKVNFLNLYPLSFMEFAEASGKSMLIKYLKQNLNHFKLEEVFHNELLSLFKVYLYVGGMPEVVASYLKNQDVQLVRKIQHEILNAYLHDFSKHAEDHEVIKILKVWQSIPSHLSKENKKFMFSAIAKSARAREYENALHWLSNAGLVLFCHNVTAGKIPLAGYQEEDVFKVYFLDVGLLGASVDLSSQIFAESSRWFVEMKGAIVENFVAQELVCSGYSSLYYWRSEGISEVDFLIQTPTEIVPVEVKSGKTKNNKSLREFQKKFGSSHVVCASSTNFKKDADFIQLPIYAVSLIQLVAASHPGVSQTV